MKSEFDQLVSEAMQQPFLGWDFVCLEGSYIEEMLPWDYREVLLTKTKKVRSMPDLGTGGGEFLSSLGPLAGKAYATEAYAPDLAIARDRLKPLGVYFVEIGADDVLPRHRRVLRPSNRPARVVFGQRTLQDTEARFAFVTQQVGPTNNREIAELFENRTPDAWSLEEAVAKLKTAGLRVIHTANTIQTSSFRDVGALVYYLRTIPWQVPGFSVDKHIDELMKVHNTIRRKGEFEVTTHRCLIEAEKPKNWEGR